MDMLEEFRVFMRVVLSPMNLFEVARITKDVDSEFGEIK
jgi:hypothetical protein